MEENGRIRRGYFVAGLGATQFALPGALDLLRSLRDAPDDAEIAVLAATDPANPYGAALEVAPRRSTQNSPSSQNSPGSADSAGSALDVVDAGRGPTRIGRRDGDPRQRRARRVPAARRSAAASRFCPTPSRIDRAAGRAVARVLIDRARAGGDAPRGMLIEEIDGAPPSDHPLSPLLIEAGFVAGAMGLQATFTQVGQDEQGQVGQAGCVTADLRRLAGDATSPV